MYKKNVLLAFVSAFLLLATFGPPITIPVRASTFYVYPGESIQTAINLAQPGDTIFVYAGTYYEHVRVNKTLSLLGEDQVTTIVDGEGNGTVIKVTADNVNINGFTIQNGGDLPYSGLFVGNSNGNTISNNTIRNSAYGIELLKSNGSDIVGNTIMNNSWAGVYIHDSNENIIYGNTITNNSIGAWIASSAVPNTFYHNNFINNTIQQSSPAPTRWDSGTEGNYWSDYSGMDTDGDGIGDTLLPHVGVDDYPLMNPIKMFRAIWNSVTYYVHAFSNSTLVAFNFSQPEKQVSFNVTGPSGAFGYCRVTIPKDLLWGEYTVYLDGSQVNYTRADSDTHAFLFFTYEPLNTRKVQVVGEYVAPEFPAAIVLSLFIFLTLVAAVLRRSKKRTSEL